MDVYILCAKRQYLLGNIAAIFGHRYRLAIDFDTAADVRHFSCRGKAAAMHDDVAPRAIIAAKQQLRISGIMAGLFMRRKAQFRRPCFVEHAVFTIDAQHVKHRLRISGDRRKFGLASQ